MLPAGDYIPGRESARCDVAYRGGAGAKKKIPLFVLGFSVCPEPVLQANDGSSLVYIVQKKLRRSLLGVMIMTVLPNVACVPVRAP